MAATRLSLYNGALRLLGARSLSSLSENREPRRVLDDIWNGGATDYCLQQGFWNFAARSMEIQYDTTITPAFGYVRAFSKTSDWMRTAAVSDSETFDPPLTDYRDEAGYLYANSDTLYVTCISNDASYGNDLSRWPSNFQRFHESYLAHEACDRITQSTTKKGEVYALMKQLLKEAKSTDAMDEPTRFPARGTWSTSRRGYRIWRERSVS
jgi:hypothetical protein